MRRKLSKPLFIIVMLIVTFQLHAQVKQENSPYSRFGLGSLFGEHQPEVKAMGGIGVAFTDSLKVNNANPASLSDLKRTAFSFGVNSNVLLLRTADEKLNSGNVTISHLNLGFPLGKKKNGGLAFGLLPYSKVAYNVREISEDPIGGRTINRYIGDGGNFQTHLSGAYQYKGFKVGITGAYIFGRTEKEAVIENADSAFVFNYRENEDVNVGGLNFKGGIQYTFNIDKLMGINQEGLNILERKKRTLTVGLTGENGGTLKAKKTFVNDRYFYNASVPISIDTIGTETVLENCDTCNVILPSKLGFGLYYNNSNKWGLGLSAEYWNWEKFRDFGTNEALKNDLKVSFGGFYTPSTRRSINTKYRQLITYRFGTYYSTGNISLRNTDISEYGITFGLQLPFNAISKYEYAKGVSSINLSIEAGNRGTLTNDLFREAFVKTTIGFNLNDIWFRKRKIN